MRTRLVVLIAIVETILFFGHWLVYETWTSFMSITRPYEVSALRTVFAILSISFVATTLLAFRSAGITARLFYRIASVWLGVLNFLFIAACLCWVVYWGGMLGANMRRPMIAITLFGLGICVSIYGFINAARIRVKQISIKLPNLPEAWRGRVAAMVSDLHLGHVNGIGFAHRVLRLLRQLKPDIVFIVGDLYDGTKVNPEELAAPWKSFSAPRGIFFVTGNHEEFFHPEKYLQAVTGAGIHILNNERVSVEGLQILGIRDRDLTRADGLESLLNGADLDPNLASVLLTHSPHGMDIAEKHGVSLQLSGHTHRGQVFPFTWITKRVFQQYTYGLSQFGALITYTSSGVGTWGPPMRVGSHPEIVFIRFE